MPTLLFPSYTCYTLQLSNFLVEKARNTKVGKMWLKKKIQFDSRRYAGVDRMAIRQIYFLKAVGRHCGNNKRYNHWLQRVEKILR
jgi:hypothetical protein